MFPVTQSVPPSTKPTTHIDEEHRLQRLKQLKLLRRTRSRRQRAKSTQNEDAILFSKATKRKRSRTSSPSPPPDPQDPLLSPMDLLLDQLVGPLPTHKKHTQHPQSNSSHSPVTPPQTNTQITHPLLQTQTHNTI